MALRDELRKEVADIKSQQQRESEKREADEAYYKEQLMPAMAQVHAYFSEVISNLQIIVPEVFPSYPLNAISENDVKLRQCDYKYRVDDGKAPREVDVLCQAVLDRPIDFYVPTRERAEKHSALLDAYDFAYHRKNFLDKHFNIKGATFFLEGPMHINIRISASAQDRCLYIDLRNLGDQKSKRYKFQAKDFTEEFFDRLANLLLHKEAYLIPPKVDRVRREELRRQLDIENEQKEKDLAAALELQEQRKQSEKEAMLRNKTKRAVAEGSRSLLKRAKQGVAQARDLLSPTKKDEQN